MLPALLSSKEALRRLLWGLLVASGFCPPATCRDGVEQVSVRPWIMECWAGAAAAGGSTAAARAKLQTAVSTTAWQPGSHEFMLISDHGPQRQTPNPMLRPVIAD